VNDRERDADFRVANRLFFRLYQASNLLHKQGTRYIDAFGSTTQQWAVLGALARARVEAKGMTVKELIGVLEVSRQNLTPVLARLEGRGWIERAVDPDDARGRRIRLTGEGRETWRGMQVPIGAFYANALRAFSREERTALGDLLDRLKDALVDV
jgi:DNA-binding MarR family transcriptional regulator